MKRKYLLMFIATITIIVGCQREPQVENEDTEAMEAHQNIRSETVEEVEVDLLNQEGVSIGTATLKEEEKGVRITLDAHHLPAGVHGFHIHEKGICEAPSFESAGGHFNPDGKQHGFHDPDGPHAGDMENIEVEADGTVEITVLNERVSLEKGVKHSLFHQDGTSLMIHADADDYKSQPAGNAGERIACGVIYKGD